MHETLDMPANICSSKELKSYQASPEKSPERSLSPVLRAPVISNTEVPFSEQKHGSKMIPYRHHIVHNKLGQGKVLCSRALLEKDFTKKYI